MLTSVNSLVFDAIPIQEVLQQVQHLGHLGEDEDPVALLPQLLQHLVEEGQLTAGLRHGANLKETVGSQRGFLSRT